MSNGSYKLEWELQIGEKGEEAGLSYRLVARLTNLEQQPPRIKRWWLAHIPLEWIREPELRFGFWEAAESGLTNLDIAKKDRELITTKLARVVEPVTEEEGKALDQDPEISTLKVAFGEAIKLRDQMDAKRGPETEARFIEAWNRAEQLWTKDYERRKERYQEETRGI
jgi:hypothetical protein